ncbi:MAG: response regulator [Prevotellaceae bacterium]|jgi:CheY-like chemotaxis protein|nr:response regulator [Prevotellaceae bacterium]
METTEYKPLLLVAEDDDSNFRLIDAIIGKQCVIKWAKTGEEMVNLFHEHIGEVEAMLMDIKMPVMTGLQATQLIRKEDEKTPIIVQTAYAFASDREAAMKAGATEVLVKPITLNVLRTCISKYLPKIQWPASVK